MELTTISLVSPSIKVPNNLRLHLKDEKVSINHCFVFHHMQMIFLPIIFNKKELKFALCSESVLKGQQMHYNLYDLVGTKNASRHIA